jgi:hypothetical protein
MENAIGKTPVHLWIIGGLATVWNAFGCYDYLMTRTRNIDYLQRMMPTVDPQEMLAYIDSFPIWAQFGWGLGVWGGLLGSILLLLRNRWAVVALALSLVGALLGIGYQIANPGGPAAMNEGANAIMPYVVIAVALGLVGYARAMKAKGVLN